MKRLGDATKKRRGIESCIISQKEESSLMNRSNLLKQVFLFLTVFISSSLYAQLGQKIEAFSADYFDKPVIKENLYGRDFLKLTKTKNDTDIKSEYLFLNDELVQVKIVADNDKVSWRGLGEEFRKMQWDINFSDEKIEEVEKSESFTAYFGENGGLLVVGKGKNKGVMFFGSAKMRFVTDRWLKTQVSQENQKSDSGAFKLTNIKAGGRLKPVYNTDGTFKGYMSDKGLFFNQNMNYEGWIGK
jgi:hypothetical protein